MAEPDAAPAATPVGRKKKTDEKFVRNTLARFATAMIGIPILLWLMFLAPWWQAFQIVLLLCIARAAHELFRVVAHGAPLLHAWGVIATVTTSAVMIFVPTVAALMTLIIGIAATGALAGLIYPEPHEEAGTRTAWMIAGPMWIGGMIAALGKLHQLEHGGEWVLLAMWLAWASDTGAYFAGRYFGKTKLYPKVSPSKTVEGSIGGLAASLTGGLAAHFWFMPSLPLVDAIVLSLIGGALGQLGDLVESLVKRSTGVKDSGSILPGHGGLLDRVDALMFTATACWIYNVWIAPLRG
jgi:phosphatidate cytidylyltransferase